MENKNDIQELINSFVEYRNLLSPIEQNLRNFAETYENMQNDIKQLGKTFDGNVQNKLDGIYSDLSKQFEKSKNLVSQLDSFKQKTEKFEDEMGKILQTFANIEQRIERIDYIENSVNSKLATLDGIIEQKKKMYNLKDLEKNLENYNTNVQKINDYINKDIATALKNNEEKIGNIKDKSESVLENLLEENSNISALVESYNQTNKLLKTIIEQNDVNEQAIFDIMDKWAKDRSVKTKK